MDAETLSALKGQYWEVHDSVVRDLIRVALRRKITQEIADGKEQTGLLGLAVQRVGAQYFARQKMQPVSYFVTISAKDAVDPVSFFRQMEKVRAKKALQGTGVYVIEQRSEGDQEPYGWHIHWLVRPEQYVSKSVVVQQVSQCFVRYIAAANYVDVRPVKQDEQAVLLYMDGQKKPEKMEKVKKDVILRNRFQIPPKVVY